MSGPDVSVVIPVFNGAQWLPKSIPDILAQTMSDLELIIVDDGSTDDSLDVARSFTDPRIRVERQERGGIAGALNVGLSKARGRWLSRQDVDDRSDPRRLELQLAAAQGGSNVVAVGCTFEVTDSEGNVRSVIAPPTRHDDIVRRMLVRNPFAGGSVVFDVAALRAIGGFDGRHRATEDYAALAELRHRGQLTSAPEALYRWRVHSTNTSFLFRDREHDMVPLLHDEMWAHPPTATSRRALAARLSGYADSELEMGKTIAGQLLRTEALIGRTMLRRGQSATGYRQLLAVAGAAPRYAPWIVRELPEAVSHLRGTTRARISA